VDTEALALQMRSVHHVLRPLSGFCLHGDPLAQIHAEMLQLPIAEMFAAASFRVTTQRVGRHGFTSLDVQRVAGAALVERYGRPVDLDHGAVQVRVDILEGLCLVSLQLTRLALSHRSARAYRPRAALKTPVAFAMLSLAGLQAGAGAVLDPFCGSGTILVEAAAVNPALALCGSDLFPGPLAGAQANLAELGLAERIQLRQADARTLSQHYPEAHFRAIVTNPPYGVTLGRKLDFRRFYGRFLAEAGKVLAPGGLLVMTAWKHGDLVRARRDHGGFAPRHVRVVETGDLYPRIFVLQRQPDPTPVARS
jgi:tRNA (guanine6-N2)-methyltransferase